MAKSSFPRKRLFVDIQVQGALAVRAVLYWLLCLFAIGGLLLLWRMVAMPVTPLDQHLRELWSYFRPTAMVSLLLLPIVVVDLLRLSNRFAGPIFRLRRTMRELAEGKSVEEIRFRKGDFWQDLAGDFNTVAAQLQKARALAAEPQAVPEEEVEMAASAG